MGKAGTVYQFVWPVTPSVRECFSHVVCSSCLFEADFCVYCQAVLVPPRLVGILAPPMRSATLKDLQDSREHPVGSAEIKTRSIGA